MEEPVRLRVIQAGEKSGLPQQIGALCWSTRRWWRKSDESTRMKTLYIRKNEKGLRDLSVFDSEFDYYREEDGNYIYRAVSTPLVLKDTDMMVHLQSTRQVKMDAVALVEEKGQ